MQVIPVTTARGAAIAVLLPAAAAANELSSLHSLSPKYIITLRSMYIIIYISQLFVLPDIADRAHEV